MKSGKRIRFMKVLLVLKQIHLPAEVVHPKLEAIFKPIAGCSK
jgi:hypothetical protein